MYAAGFLTCPVRRGRSLLWRSYECPNLPLLFDWILSRQHQEWIRQWMGLAAGREVPFLHRLQQRALRFRRRAINLVRQDHVAKERPLHEAEHPFARRAVFLKDIHPALGPQGLFYYFHTMTKDLTLYGSDLVETKQGQTINWRDQLALKLINLQRADGSWANDNGRWFEKDNALVTAYAVIALDMIRPKL